jgi:NAD(P)-dependent dehydrogenase (short-subunit alcohol dehydrogenase family)
MAPWTTADIPNQRGKTAVVTGANRGVGYQVALELARAGALVILACRSGPAGEEAHRTLRATLPGASTELRSLDLASLRSVRDFAAAAPARVDILVNNAGVMGPPLGFTEDGFERQLGTNFLGHFALTGLLLPRLEAAPAARVVNTSSNMHRLARSISWDNLKRDRGYSRWIVYGETKLAALLFAYELDRRARRAGSSLRSTAAHPGFSARRLDLAPDAGAVDRLKVGMRGVAVRLLGQPSSGGALPLLFAATADVPGGSYAGPSRMQRRGPPKLVQSSAASHDEAAARKLWELSEQLTGVRVAFAERGKVGA